MSTASTNTPAFRVVIQSSSEKGSSTASVGTQVWTRPTNVERQMNKLRRRLQVQKEETEQFKTALALAEKALKTKDATIDRWKNAHEDTEGELMEALDNLHNAEVDLEVHVRLADEELSAANAEVDAWKAVQRGVENAHHDEIQKFKDAHEDTNAEMKTWIGACLKFKFLAAKIKDLLPESAADDIIECFDDIEIPEVDEETRAEFVVTETSNSVVETSTLAQDREYYGEDFYEEDAATVVNTSEPVDPSELDAANAALEEGLQIDRLTNLFYELGIQSSIMTMYRFEINSISELREHLRMNWAPFEPGNSEEFGISEETLQVLSEWNQSLTEEESREIYTDMGRIIDHDQFRQCLETNDWPEGAVQLTMDQFSELQEWDRRYDRVNIDPCRSRSFVIDMNSGDFQATILDVELEEPEEVTDGYGHTWHSGLTEIGGQVYDKKDLKAALVFQRFYMEKKKKEGSAERIQRVFRDYLGRRRTRRVRTLRVRRRLNYAE